GVRAGVEHGVASRRRVDHDGRDGELLRALRREESSHLGFEAGIARLCAGSECYDMVRRHVVAAPGGDAEDRGYGALREAPAGLDAGGEVVADDRVVRAADGGGAEEVVPSVVDGEEGSPWLVVTEAVIGADEGLRAVLLEQDHSRVERVQAL